MNFEKTDLIMHPVRFRILTALGENKKTTRELCAEMSDVPVSSIYRHMKILLDTDLIQVASTNTVKGIQEKVYDLHQQPKLYEKDMQDLGKDQQKMYFASYLSSILSRFSQYIQHSKKGAISEDMTGYTETEFYVNRAEMQELIDIINNKLLELQKNQPGNGRHRQLLSLILFPLDKQKE